MLPKNNITTQISHLILPENPIHYIKKTMKSSLSYMILFAIFINAILIPLFGLAVSKNSTASKSVATVTLGASIPVSSGDL